GGTKIHSKRATRIWIPTDTTGLSLSPLTNSAVAGADKSATFTATLVDQAANPKPGIAVTFNVLTGPNAGKTATVNTNNDGIATFTYFDTGGPGADIIEATFVNPSGQTIHSAHATQNWI